MESPAFGQINRDETLGRMLDYGINQEDLDNMEFTDTGMVKLLHMIKRINRSRLAH
jgi:hypothetical protein